jgi:hypothetical protein
MLLLYPFVGAFWPVPAAGGIVQSLYGIFRTERNLRLWRSFLTAWVKIAAVFTPCSFPLMGNISGLLVGMNSS